MNFLDHLVSLGVCALKLSPTMDVERLLKLILQELAFLLLLKQLFLKDVDLLLKIWDASSLTLRDQKLTFKLSNFLPNIFNIG